MYSVYKITFEDGFAYVGMTKFPIEDRIRRHIVQPDNAELCCRLTKGYPYTTEILYESIPKEHIAYDIEGTEIRKLEKPINLSRLTPKQKATQPDFKQPATRPETHTQKKKKNFSPREGFFFLFAVSST